MLVDTHAHLTMAEFAADLPEVLDRAEAAGVATIVCVGVDLPSSRDAVDLAQRYPGVVATVGVHPNECAELPPGWLGELRALAGASEVVALGEMGLDYYRHRTSHERQQEVLKAQLELARDLGLPVVVHDRQADEDLAEILAEWAGSLPEQHPRGVMHCFSGDLPLMNRCCRAGFYLSFAGPITYRNAGMVAEMAATAPRDRLLVETDSPFLAPHPYRGKRNEPAHVRLVAERMAALRHEGLEAIEEVTGRNAAMLFGLDNQSVLSKRG
ncbi:MAG: TatD family hydrolase [Chloroflexota bacterium]